MAAVQTVAKCHKDNVKPMLIQVWQYESRTQSKVGDRDPTGRDDMDTRQR